MGIEPFSATAPADLAAAANAKAWREEQHPRHPKGTGKGGEFASRYHRAAGEDWPTVPGNELDPAETAPLMTADGDYVLYHGTSATTVSSISADGFRGDSVGKVGFTTHPADAGMMGSLKAGRGNRRIMEVVVSGEWLRQQRITREGNHAGMWLVGRGKSGQVIIPPEMLKSIRVYDDWEAAIAALPDAARDVHNKQWREEQHPRHPAGAGKGLGGQFAPKGATELDRLFGRNPLVPRPGVKEEDEEEEDKKKLPVSKQGYWEFDDEGKLKTVDKLESGGETTVELDAFFRDYGVNMSHEEFITRAIGPVPDGLEVKVDGVMPDADAGDLQLDVEFLDDQGIQIGAMRRVYNFKRAYVYHDVFSLAGTWTGTGFAADHLASATNLYDDLGLTSVRLTANLDVGGYAWARYGFLPSEEQWRMLRDRTLQRIEAGEVSGTEEDYDELFSILHTNDPRGIRLLAEAKVGKQILLNEEWKGTLNLQDKESRLYFDAYMARRREKKKRAA